MQKKDLAKQQRRKRKDPESRDFKCNCGKSYLSYAAVYTHVKNQHKGEKQFQESIIKPEKQKLKRGRPRDKKKVIITSQTQILSICQQTTLLIYEQLKQQKEKFDHHIILQGNDQMNEEAFQKQYQRLNEKKEIKLTLFQDEWKESKDSKCQDENKIFEKFLKGVIKHFSAQIAARVSYVINYLAQIYEEINFEDKNEVDSHLKYLDNLEIWQGSNSINKIIYEAMVHWLQVLRKEQQQVEEQ